jgi:uncharacterized membrane protein
MSNFWTVAFLAVLTGLTLLAIWRWYTRRGASVPEAERRVFARFILGLVVFWLLAIVAYFGGPLLSTIR